MFVRPGVFSNPSCGILCVEKLDTRYIMLNSLLWRALTVLKAVAKQVLLALLRNKTARHSGNYSLTIKRSMNDSEHILFWRLFIQFIFISSGENKERLQDIKHAISSLILTTFQKLKKYMLVFLLSCPALVYQSKWNIFVKYRFEQTHIN